MATTTPLEIQDGLIICGDDELAPFLSHPDHRTIMNRMGFDVGIRDGKKLPKMMEGKYDLRIVESLLIQSRYV
jgi:hypothetical protein